MQGHQPSPPTYKNENGERLSYERAFRGKYVNEYERTQKNFVTAMKGVTERYADPTAPLGTLALEEAQQVIGEWKYDSLTKLLAGEHKKCQGGFQKSPPQPLLMIAALFKGTSTSPPDSLIGKNFAEALLLR